MISVVIPVFNKESYIEETIRSVLNQSFESFELILVDDGSRDNSLQILRSFNDERIRVISIKNSGVSIARNIGIKAAHFPYIAFLDADDWWEADYLTEIVSLIRHFPDKSVFATGKSSVYGGKATRYSNCLIPEDGSTGLVDYIEVISEYSGPINSSDAVIKKSVLLNVGMFNSKQRNHEDHDLWLRVCWNNQIAYKNKPLSFSRRMVNDSASQNIYKPADFVEYLNTIEYVSREIESKRRKKFEKYFNKFIILTFLKYKKNYSKSERQDVLRAIKRILSNDLLIIVKLIDILPFQNLYENIRSLKRALSIARNN